MPESAPFSRRTVLRTAAWSTPTVALATSAPAFAASAVDQVNLSVEFRTKVPGWYTPGQNHDFAFTVHNAGPAALPAGAVVRLTAPHGNFISGFTAVGTSDAPAPQFTTPAPGFLTYSGGPTHTSVTLDAATTVDIPAGGALQIQGYFTTTTEPSPDLHYNCPNGGSPNGTFGVQVNPAPGQTSTAGNRLENIGPARTTVPCLPNIQIADAPAGYVAGAFIPWF